MIEIKVTVEAPELAVSIQGLATVMAALLKQNDARQPQILQPEVKAIGANKPEQPKTEQPLQGATPETAGTTETAKEIDPKPEYTLEQVRAKLAALSQDGKQAQVKKIITEAGAKKLTEIPPEKYAEVMAKAEAI